MPQRASPHVSNSPEELDPHGEPKSRAHLSASAASSEQEHPEGTAAGAASWGLPMMSPLSGRTQAYLKGARVLDPNPEPVTSAPDMPFRESPKASFINGEPEEPEAGSQPLAPGPPSQAFQKQKPKRPAAARPFENGHASGQTLAPLPTANGHNSNEAATEVDRAVSGGLKRGFFGNRKPSPMPGQHANKHADSLQHDSMPAQPAGLHPTVPAEQDSMAGAAYNASADLNGKRSDDLSSTDESMPDLEEVAADHAPAFSTNDAAAAAAPTAAARTTTHAAAAASSVGSTPQTSSSAPSADAHHPPGGTLTQNLDEASLGVHCLTLLGCTFVSLQL